MITALTAAGAAMALGLPILGLGERIRDLRLSSRHNAPTWKDAP